MLLIEEISFFIYKKNILFIVICTKKKSKKMHIQRFLRIKYIIFLKIQTNKY